MDSGRRGVDVCRKGASPGNDDNSCRSCVGWITVEADSAAVDGSEVFIARSVGTGVPT